MKTECYIKIYDQAKAKIPEQLIPVMEGYERVLRGVSCLFYKQIEHRFYFGNFTRDELVAAAQEYPRLLSPYTLVKKKEGINPLSLLSKLGLLSKFDAVDYKDEPTYRSSVLKIARALEDLEKYVEDEKPPQWRLILATLKPQDLSWRNAQFEQAREQHINTRNSPDLELVTGLFDKYKDVWGLKYSAQAWALNLDRDLTDYYSKLVRIALRGTRQEYRNQVRAGDAVGFAGLAALKEWNGNSLPSEDELRREIGSISYIFNNVMEANFTRKMRQAFLKYAPQVQEIGGWEVLAKKAMAINLAFHEGVGHPLVGFNRHVNRFVKYDDELLGENYVYIKELESETRAQRAVLDLPKKDLASDPKKAEDLKRMVMLTSLVWARLRIDDYLSEPNPEKKQVSQVYACIGTMGLNRLARNNGISVNPDNNQINIINLDQMRQTIGEYLDEIRETALEEVTTGGKVRELIQRDTTGPIYLPPAA